MPTIFRAGALRIVIFPGDHSPPHVHVFGDGETKVGLGTYQTRPYQIKTSARKPEARRALMLVEQRRDHLLECWIAIHGQI
jgi:hypothetical protein